MNIEEKQNQIINQYMGYTDWQERYRAIINKGRELETMDKSLKLDENKVKGCQSTVWMYAFLKDGVLHIKADSDAAIVKGLIALLVEVFSGQKPSDILNAEMSFFEKIGLNTHLSQTRVNGFAAMVKQIKLYAFALDTLVKQGINEHNVPN